MVIQNSSFFIAGVILLSTSLVLSARMGIYQEQIYSKYGRHHREALFFTVSKTNFFLDLCFMYVQLAKKDTLAYNISPM